VTGGVPAQDAIPVAPETSATPPRDRDSDRWACFLSDGSVPLAGLAPVNMRQIEEGVDAFFARLAELREPRTLGQLCLNLSPWLAVAAATAWELASLRRAMRENPRYTSLIDLVVLRMGGEA
jgi:hypothetical protein